jgi:hypothetical protein
LFITFSIFCVLWMTCGVAIFYLYWPVIVMRVYNGVYKSNSSLSKTRQKLDRGESISWPQN